MTKLPTDKVSPVARLLARHAIEAGFVVPTATALEKGIMDATWPLREYLARTGFHNYRAQGQGRNAKRIVGVRIIQSGEVIDTKMSLYRPETKQGDPRIWIYGLTKFASPADLLALIVDGRQLYVVNCSQEDLSALLADSSSLLSQIAARQDKYVGIAQELLAQLKGIGAKGFVPSLRAGDTGIGYTLESHLGIKANSRKAPDFHGIEIKSARMGRTGRVAGKQITLFSKKPDWGRSPYSARRTLDVFGYRDATSNRLQLYCSIDASQANSLGFKLDPRADDDHLVTTNISQIQGGEDVFLWMMSEIKQTFAEKHRETFCVGAQVKGVGGSESFHYVEARHTRKPPLSTFERLLAEGGICVDLTMSERGVNAVRDHGYLFRVYGQDFADLFPEVGVYSLV